MFSQLYSRHKSQKKEQTLVEIDKCKEINLQVISTQQDQEKDPLKICFMKMLKEGSKHYVRLRKSLKNKMLKKLIQLDLLEQQI